MKSSEQKRDNLPSMQICDFGLDPPLHHSPCTAMPFLAVWGRPGARPRAPKTMVPATPVDSPSQSACLTISPTSNQFLVRALGAGRGREEGKKENDR